MLQALTMFLAINAFILVLCALIAGSAYFLKQTGKVRMTINSGEPVEADCGQTLFAELTRHGIFLPAACGGKGTCGRCLVTCREGGGPLTPMERILLDERSIALDQRLSCQVKIRSNIVVEVPNELLAAKKYRVRLEKAELKGEGIRILQLNILNDQLLEFKPGQYIQVYRELPHETLVRSYSISSDPRQKNMFSLDVQKVSGGLMSTWLHQIQIGEEFEISGPYGDMTVDVSNAPIVLVAGGVGLAPMRAILADLLEVENPPQTWLFWGARHRAHLYAEAELEAIVGKNSHWLKFIPALSGDLIEEGWTGERGLIHLALQKHLPDLQNARAFICGPGPMMTAVTDVLLSKGIHASDIKADPFDFD
jgi:Na+-transporting NADH:ubiquinone oxidoreductase subunit F